MLRLHGLGWGSRRIAAELECSRTTVKRYVTARGWVPYRRLGRPRKLAGQTGWLQERLIRHRGNADVVRQDLARELGITVGLRTLEREVAPLRQVLATEDRVPRSGVGATLLSSVGCLVRRPLLAS
jgi:transposase